MAILFAFDFYLSILSQCLLYIVFLFFYNIYWINCIISKDQLSGAEVFVFQSMNGMTKVVVVFTTEANKNYHEVFGTTKVDLFESKVKAGFILLYYLFIYFFFYLKAHLIYP